MKTVISDTIDIKRRPAKIMAQVRSIEARFFTQFV